MNRRTAIAFSALALVALAACGSDDDDDQAASADAATGEAASVTTVSDRYGYGADDDDTPETTAPAAAPSGSAVAALAATGLGDVVVGADGFTLYLFLPDAGGTPTCTGGCAGSWPPVIVDASTELAGGDGIDAALLGTVPNPDGGDQLTYAGWPLYAFSGDSAPGDTNGQGSGGSWFALDATGTAIP